MVEVSPAAARPGALNQQLLRLAEVLQIITRAREVPRAELGFVIVNETIRVVAYRHAVLWDGRARSIAAVSGVARPEPAAPFVLFLTRLCRRIADTPEGRSQLLLERSMIGDLANEWHQWLAPHVMWWPLHVHNDMIGALLLDRDEPWSSADEAVLEAVCGAYAQSWELSRARRASIRPIRRRVLRRVAIVVAAAAIVAACFFPVHSSVLAPAEVVARSPAFVRAPFAGVVDEIAVAPNAAVQAGQVLVRLDRRRLETEMQVARQAVEVASAQMRQATQEAIADARAREQLAVLRGKLDEANADYEYRRILLSRTDIVAPTDGVAVFNDPTEWIGRPVETGERIMQVSPPTSTRIEIELPVADEATFEDGSDVFFFDNVTPDRPIAGTLDFTSYTTSLSVAGVLIYTCRADLADGAALRLGLKGTAKILGPERPLLLWMLRRPIAFVRALLV
jgi:hypothetical protein